MTTHTGKKVPAQAGWYLRRSALALGIAALAGPVQAGVYSLGDGFDAEYKLTINYGVSMRLKNPSDNLINGPVGTTSGLPSTINFDDGDRNFKSGSLINNRLSGLAEL